MFRWKLMLRRLFGSSRHQCKARRPRTTARPKVETLEYRTLPSTSSANPLAIVSVVSPPPVPSIAAITSYVQTSMNQWMQLLATVQQDIGNSLNALGQEIAQEVSAVQQQWDNLLGINPTPPNPSPNTTVPQPSSDSGVGRGNARGSGSGSGATTTANNASTQTLNNSTQQSGNGSGSGGSATTTGNGTTSSPGRMVAQPMSGTGSGSATVYGNVWLDSDYDSFSDNGELGYSGATVQLDRVGYGGYLSTITDANGNYKITIPAPSIPPGFTWEVQVIFPFGFFATKPGGDSQIDAQGYTQQFNLMAGDVVQKNAGIASMNVNITQDDAFAKIQDKVTLRDAIKTGNNGPPQPAVTFYTAPNTPLSGTIILQTQLDPIQTSYNIDGPGANTLTVNGNNNSGTIFTVNAGVTSTISGLTIMDGSGAKGGGILNKKH